MCEKLVHLKFATLQQNILPYMKAKNEPNMANMVKITGLLSFLIDISCLLLSYR